MSPSFACNADIVTQMRTRTLESSEKCRKQGFVRDLHSSPCSESLKVVLLGVVAEGPIADSKQVGSLRANTMRSLQRGLQIPPFGLGERLLKINTFRGERLNAAALTRERRDGYVARN